MGVVGGKGALKGEQASKPKSRPRKEKDDVIPVGKGNLKTLPKQKRKKLSAFIQSPVTKRMEVEAKVPKCFESFRIEKEPTPQAKPSDSELHLLEHEGA